VENIKATDFFETAEAIEQGRFAHWPKHIQKESLFKKASLWKDRTPFHHAAETGHFDKIPKDLYSEEDLITEGHLWRSPLQIASENGHLEQIPKEFLTERNLLIRSTLHRNSLQLACESGTLHKIPIKMKLSTLKDLLAWNQTKYGWTPWDNPAPENPFAKSSKWLQKEIESRQKEEIQKSLKNCDHSDI